MEFSKAELANVSETVSKIEDAVVELSELDLTMVGGGTGDIHFG